MNTKKFLMIANQFPPMGGSGVQRSSKFAKFLPTFGYKAVVLTKTAPKKQDQTLMKDISSDTEILRVKGADVTNKFSFFAVFNKLFGKHFCIPDSEIFWVKKAISEAFKRLKKGDISLVYSTSFPYSDHLVGLAVKKEFPHIPWVADFRDEWTLNQYMIDIGYSKSRIAKEKAMELEVLRTADFIIANTESMQKGFVSLAPEIAQKIITIPNGFDSDDFAETIDTTMDTSKFTLTHAGSMYGRRKPDTLLKAVSELASENKIDKSKLSIEFIGNIKSRRINALALELGLSDVVKTISYMPHDELIKKLYSSSALLLLEGSGAGSGNFSPGKTFEYIKLDRKILAAVPENGEAANIVKTTNSGKVANSADKEEIKRAFLELYEEFFAGNIYPASNNEAIQRYDRRNQARMLAEVFDHLLQNTPALR